MRKHNQNQLIFDKTISDIGVSPEHLYNYIKSQTCFGFIDNHIIIGIPINNMIDEQRDYFSKLPKVLIHHILSFLEYEHVNNMFVLSKKISQIVLSYKLNHYYVIFDDITLHEKYGAAKKICVYHMFHWNEHQFRKYTNITELELCFGYIYRDDTPYFKMVKNQKNLVVLRIDSRIPMDVGVLSNEYPKLTTLYAHKNIVLGDFTKRKNIQINYIENRELLIVW